MKSESDQKKDRIDQQTDWRKKLVSFWMIVKDQTKKIQKLHFLNGSQKFKECSMYQAYIPRNINPTAWFSILKCLFKINLVVCLFACFCPPKHLQRVLCASFLFKINLVVCPLHTSVLPSIAKFNNGNQLIIFKSWTIVIGQ